MKHIFFIGFLLIFGISLTQVGTFKDTRDGKVYKTVIIGTQTWMAENLNVSIFRNGDPIPEVKTKEEWEKAGREGAPAWCYYNNDSKNANKYGKLYNWYAVHDSRGLAPEGWHISTSDEFDELINYFGGKTNAGKKFVCWENNCFKANGAGVRNERGDFYGLDEKCNWWCPEWNSDYFAFNVDLDLTVLTFFKYGQLNNKISGGSVRCLKN